MNCASANEVIGKTLWHTNGHWNKLANPLGLFYENSQPPLSKYALLIFIRVQVLWEGLYVLIAFLGEETK